MITLQDTIKKAIHLKGADILAQGDKLCVILEDLSPQLIEDIAFIEGMYSYEVGRILVQAYHTTDSDKKACFAELDFCLEQESGYNEKWRRRFLGYFRDVIIGEDSERKTEEGPIETQVSPKNILQKGRNSQGVVFSLMNKDEARREAFFPVGEAVFGDQISKHLPSELIFKILYNQQNQQVGIKNLTDYTWEIVKKNYVRSKCVPRKVVPLEKEMMIRIKPRVMQMYVTELQC